MRTQATQKGVTKMNTNNSIPNSESHWTSRKVPELWIPKFNEDDNVEILQPRPEVFDGILGDITKETSPKLEPHPVGILLSLMTWVSSFLNKPVVKVTAGAEHHLNLFTVLVGYSSNARKGTSTWVATELFKEMYPDWYSDHLADGVKTAEGLINLFSDGIPIPDTDPPEFTEKGFLAHDKRALWLATEYSMVLRNMLGEKGSTIPDVVNQLFDGERIRTITKHRSQMATGVHLAFLGHITLDNLERLLNKLELTSGYANRHLWCLTHRIRTIKEETKIYFPALARKLKPQLEKASLVSELRFVGRGKEYWFEELYPQLTKSRRGNAEVLSRAEVHVPKLASLYALFDPNNNPIAGIKYEHLLSAKALWDYCEQSCYEIFPLDEEQFDNKDLQALHELMVSKGVTEIDQSEVDFIDSNFYGNKRKQFEKALKKSNLITKKEVPQPNNQGRPKNVYYLNN